MKNKSKKIIAGIGIGLTLAGSGALMTGCTNMNIPQNQIDKIFTTVDNANKFMEETSNLITDQNKIIEQLQEDNSVYDSHIAKNALYNLIIDSIEVAQNEKGLQIDFRAMGTDYFEDEVFEDSSYQYKLYRDKETNQLKQYFKLSDKAIYHESVKNDNDKYDTSTYTKDGESKTYVTSETDNIVKMTNPSMSMALYYDATECLNMFMQILASETLSTVYGMIPYSWTMQKDGNTTIFRVVTTYGTERVTCGYMELEFDGVKLLKMSTYEHTMDGTTGEELGKRNIEFLFTHDIEDFTFDTTGYVENLGE